MGVQNLMYWIINGKIKGESWSVSKDVMQRKNIVDDNKKATIIYLDNCMLISKKEYSNWLEIQEEYYENYKTSLMPMTCKEIINFFEEDFKEEKNWPFSKTCILDFFNSDVLLICSKQ